MKIMRTMTALLFASSAALVAQEEPTEPFMTYMAVGFTLAQGHAHDMTQNTWGGLGAWNAEFGLGFNLPTTNVKMRPNFGVAKMISGQPTESHPDLYDLMGMYFGFDLVAEPFVKLGLPGLTLSTGPSFNVWAVDKTNELGDANQGYKNVRLGWRFGAGYRINEKFNAILDFTQTEWRTIRRDTVNTPYQAGFNPSRPAYFTLKCVYKF
jgi:hypothetical protein